jgi:hypothetical protein
VLEIDAGGGGATKVEMDGEEEEVAAVMRCGGLTMPLEGEKRKGSRRWSHNASGRGKKGKGIEEEVVSRCLCKGKKR